MKINWTSIIQDILKASPSNPIPGELLDIPFSEAIWPWIDVARNHLYAKLSTLSLSKEIDELVSAQAMFSLEKALIKRWSELCTPSMLLQMRLQSIEFTLQGDSPQERYLNFVTNTYLKTEGLSAFFQEYRKLAHLVATYLLFWVDYTTEFIARLQTDYALLVETFHAHESLGKLHDIQMDMSDPHYKGRAVAILHFELGTSLVYKPKNVHISRTFNHLIERLNDLNLTPLLKSYQVLPRKDANGDYGWEERVLHLPCSELIQVQDYYKRAGILLGLVYLLHGTDMHYENIIAAGEFPILIDLETLFHSQLKNPHQELVDATMQHSVLATGLLPIFALRKNGEKRIDLSGLGQSGALPHSQWKHINTDMMEYTDDVDFSSYSPNQVIYQNQIVSVCDYIDDIVSGFRKLYTTIQNHYALLESEQWFAKMANQTIRIVLRPTRFYAYILQNLHSPYHLLHEELSEKELALLQRPLGFHEQVPDILEMEEKKALLQGDIPCFTTIPDSTNLFFLDTLIATDCLESNAYQQVLSRLHKMGIEDCNQQERFIRQAFAIKHAEVHGPANNSLLSKSSSCLRKNRPLRNEILEQTKTLGHHLKKQAIVANDGSLGWIHLEPLLDTGQYNVQALGESLYSGRVGIALFFAALSKITGDLIWQEATLHTLLPLRKLIERGRTESLLNLYGIGGMTGSGGIIYGISQIAKLLKLPELMQIVQVLLNHLQESHILTDTQYDLMGGSAGLLLALITYYTDYKDAKALELARLCGHHLCDQAVNLNASALGWKVHGHAPLLGLSHGAAGIAYALLKLNFIEKHAKFIQTARGALTYERQQFCADKGNWPRLDHQKKAIACSWCHGATGIGLARLATQSFLSDTFIDQEIHVALETTQHHLHEGPLNLCCGPLGRLEFLQTVSQRHNRPELSLSAQDAFADVFDYVTEQNQSEVFHSSPSFMQGAAGLGYTLLRSIDSEKCLPQVLLLENALLT